MTTDPVVILSYARTPMGSFQGSLTDASATELGAAAVSAAVKRAGLNGEAVERIYMGCVLPAGLGQAPARQAGFKGGLPRSTGAVTGVPERLIQFVKRCAAEFGLTGRWGFQYANTCSRPRVDGFGGGAHVLDLATGETVDWIYTDGWLDQTLSGEGGPL